MEAFVEIAGADTEHKNENLWFDECQQKQIPFIKIVSRTKFADVHWDYITYDAKLDSSICKHDEAFVNNTLQIYRTYANKESSYKILSTVIWLYNLEVQQARFAAKELFDCIVKRIGAMST